MRQLYETYHDRGLEILAFPVNQFGGQAPLSDEGERAWAIRKFGIDGLIVLDHVAALDKPTPQWSGPEVISPVYRLLKDALPGELPWNYTKFLVGRDGVPLRRYSPGDPLDQGMEEDIKHALEGKPLRKHRSEK